MKPILFNTEMVRANLDGRKNNTRRLLKGYALEHLQIDTDGSIIGVYDQKEGFVRPVTDYAPYQPDDILYVRETWRVRNVFGDIARGDRTAEIEFMAGGDTVCVPAFDYTPSYGAWKPSIHMPKEAARLFLWVKSVTVERLKDITIQDAIAEGCEGVRCDHPNPEPGIGCTDCYNTGWIESPVAEFAELWDITIKKSEKGQYGWDANPWVWVIEYERCEKPKEL